MNQNRLMTVLRAPVISEKSTFVAEKNEQVVFEVLPDATKPEVKAAVELLFKVQVESVQMLNRPGKVKRFGRAMGRRKTPAARMFRSSPVKRSTLAERLNHGTH